MKDNNELWLELIKRDIPKWEEYELPETSPCWYDIYCDLREQVQKSVDEDAAKLKMALDGISSERAKHCAKFVTDRRSISLPRERPTAKQRYASYDRKMGGIAPVFVPPKPGINSTDPLGATSWSFERPQMPRSETTPSRKKKTIFSATKRNSILSVPTQKLNTRASQVKQAPRALVEEHRRPSEPVAPRRNGPLQLIAPGRSRMRSAVGSTSEGNMAVTPSLREREARLRALTSGTRVESKDSKRSKDSNSLEEPRTLSNGPASSTARQIPRNESPKTKPQQHTPSPKPGGQEKNVSDTGSDTSSAQAPRPAIIRKRPAPSVFITPKKKRLA